MIGTDIMNTSQVVLAACRLMVRNVSCAVGDFA